MAFKFFNKEKLAEVRAKLNIWADEINALTLFTPKLTNGKIDKANLPDAELHPDHFVQSEETGYLDLNQNWLITLVDARIAAAGMTPPPENITPPAPTVTFNDTTRLLTITHALGNSKIVYNVNGGAFQPYTEPIDVGLVARAEGYIKTKTIAFTDGPQGYNESPVRNSPTISASTISDLDLLTSWPTLETVTVSGNTLTASAASGLAVSGKVVPAAGAFVLQLDGSNIESSGYLGVAANSSGGVINFLAAVAWKKSAELQGRFYGIASGVGFDDYSNVGYTGTPLGRVRGTGTVIHIEKSFDEGATWVAVDGTKTVPQPNTALVIKAFFDDINAPTVRNAKSKGV